MARGSVVVEHIDSEVLEGNPLGDPTERDIHVYLPPGYKGQPLPVVYGVVGYTGSGGSLFNIDPLVEPLHQRMDRLIRTQRCGPMVIACPDCFTRVGGNQYINSTATGRYEDFLLREVIPFVEEKYPATARAVWGKSSGGYGSMVQGMRHPEVFSALADHSGDAAFEWCYLPDFPKALDAFRKARGPKKWLDQYWKGPNRRKSEQYPVLNTIGMAAHYSPNSRSPYMGIDFPFDLDTGEFKPRVWARWRNWDPVNMISRYARNLKRHRLVYIDCGTKDEFNLHWGARLLHDRLMLNGVKHFYEEFEDGHLNIPYRYDRSLPMLHKALNTGT